MNPDPNEVISDLWVCVDCVVFIANGDLPEDPKIAKKILAGVEREAPGQWVCDGPHEDDGEGEEDDTLVFSRSPCDCCGSCLGGERHRCAIVFI